MDTLSLVSEYLKDLEECMDDGDSEVAKEEKLFDALEHKSVVIEVDNQKIAIFTKALLRAFGEPFMRKMVNDVNVEIHGVKFKADFVVLICYWGEPSIMSGRDFLVTTKSQVDFGLGEIRMNLTKFKEGIEVIDHLKRRKVEEISPISAIPPQLIYHPLTQKQKEKMKEVLDIKYKELEESKPILEVLENYVVYKKKLDEILIGKKRLNKKEFSEDDKVGIIKHGLPKKICDPGNYVFPVKINGVVEMVALVDIGATKPMGEVKNVRIQIGYQAYVVDLLILDILVDPELPLLLGRPFLRTCGAIIDMGRGTLCIDDRVIHHTYFPKPRSKSYVEAFEMEGEDDWLGSFEVGRDEDGNVKYGPVAPSFIDIEDDMERALAMEAYFNPFKNVIVFKKLVDFLGSLPVQLKNLDWGNEGYGTYKKIDGDGDWHARFEIVTPSGRKFNRAFKTKTTTRKLSGKFKTEDVLRFSHFLD
ncbi:putative ribonuclease H-like domain-containing protein [Tanacetum coccineum]